MNGCLNDPMNEKRVCVYKPPLTPRVFHFAGSKVIKTNTAATNIELLIFLIAICRHSK